MDAYLLDWVNLLLRWAHIIVAIAWIGASFYFVMLDNSLTKPTDGEFKNRGVDGELWAVHGGGFYNSHKYLVAPGSLPQNLHWSFWESYSTWLTGFALFTVLYLFNPSTFLIDRTVYAWSSPAWAVVGALAFLVGFWLVYDLICRALGRRQNGDLIVGVSVFAFVVFASWLACHLFAGRAAFLLVGAMLATSMSANVFFWIIPGQRKVVAQMRAGEPVDPIHGQRGKQRSVHNTYFTLPVIVAMLSNHYGWLYQSKANWMVLVLLMLAGALIRHSFVARHKVAVLGQKAPWGHAIAGVVLIIVIGVWQRPDPIAVETTSQADIAVGALAASVATTAPASGAAPAHSSGAPSTAEIEGIVQQRCVMCHNATVQQKNVALHTSQLLERHAQQVYLQAAVQKLMPLNNATQITEAERQKIKLWFESRGTTQ